MGVRPETGLPKKGKSGDRIAFKPGTKPGKDPEVVFARIITPPQNNMRDARIKVFETNPEKHTNGTLSQKGKTEQARAQPRGQRQGKTETGNE